VLFFPFGCAQGPVAISTLQSGNTQIAIIAKRSQAFERHSYYIDVSIDGMPIISCEWFGSYADNVKFDLITLKDILILQSNDHNKCVYFAYDTSSRGYWSSVGGSANSEPVLTKVRKLGHVPIDFNSRISIANNVQ